MRNRPNEAMLVVYSKPGKGALTSPSNRRILKLLLLILSWGDPGKQLMQLVRVYTRSRKYCAMMNRIRMMAQLFFFLSTKLGGQRWRVSNLSCLLTADETRTTKWSSDRENYVCRKPRPAYEVRWMIEDIKYDNNVRFSLLQARCAGIFSYTWRTTCGWCNSHSRILVPFTWTCVIALLILGLVTIVFLYLATSVNQRKAIYSGTIHPTSSLLATEVLNINLS